MRHFFLLTILAAALPAFAQPAPASAPAPVTPPADQLPPVDEAAKDPDFKAFRDRLAQAVKQRDRKIIIESITPDIVNGHDLGRGREVFAREWFRDARESPLWETLGALLALGGSFQPTDEGDPEFWAPYVYSEFPEERAGLDEAVALGPAVAVRARPEIEAKVVATLNHAIVKVADFKPVTEKSVTGERLWLKIINPDGSFGWVEKRELRTPSDYRACFRKIKGQWKMTLLLTGE